MTSMARSRCGTVAGIPSLRRRLVLGAVPVLLTCALHAHGQTGPPRGWLFYQGPRKRTRRRSLRLAPDGLLRR